MYYSFQSVENVSKSFTMLVDAVSTGNSTKLRVSGNHFVRCSLKVSDFYDFLDSIACSVSGVSYSFRRVLLVRDEWCEHPFSIHVELERIGEEIVFNLVDVYYLDRTTDDYKELEYPSHVFYRSSCLVE